MDNFSRLLLIFWQGNCGIMFIVLITYKYHSRQAYTSVNVRSALDPTLDMDLRVGNFLLIE